MADFPVGNDPAAGIIITHHHVGLIGTASNNKNPGLIAHEAGHCLGLFHIWGPSVSDSTWQQCHPDDDGDTNGDFVDDTPPQVQYSLSDIDCAVFDTNTCISAPIGQIDRHDDINNAMSYIIGCENRFTEDQDIKRMKPNILGAYQNHWSPVNLDCAGLETLFPNKVVQIIQNTTWTTANLPNGGEITMDKIVVKSGFTLIINTGVKVHFRRCEESNLIIEPGAKLILRGTLTNSQCNPSDYWYGVEVAGIDMSQPLFLSGEFKAESGSVIENAIFGVRNRAVINGIIRGGGKITCNAATFRNNGIGVRFYPYILIDKPSPPGQWFVATDGSSFTDCIFTITPQGMVPLIVRLKAHVYLEGIKGVTFRFCAFNNLKAYGGDGLGTGLYAVDAGFTVESGNFEDFKGLRFGIHTIRAFSNQPFTVKKCDFDGCNVGIYNSGVSNGTIIFNRFYLLNSNTVQLNDQFGIYQEGPLEMTDIQENQFNDPDHAISPRNSIGICSNNLGGFTNTIRRNIFDHVTVSNIANGINGDALSNGLQYQCNTNLDLQAYDIALTAGASIRPIQEGPLQFGQPSSAGNKFAYFNVLPEDDITSTGAPFTYRYNPPTGNDEPIEVTIGKVVKVTTPQPNACGQIHQLEPPPPREQWSVNYQSSQTPWQTARQQYMTALDGGNTVALVSMVANATSVNIASVMNTLNSISPWLSERVFRTLIGKYPLVSSFGIRDLLLTNPDVLSDGDFWNFLQNCGLFSEPEMQAFTNATTTVTGRTSIQQNMASHKAEMDYWGTLYFNDYLHEHPDYTSSWYQTFMQGFASYQTDALVVEELLRYGNLTQALNLVNSMGSTYCITDAEFAQHAQYQQLVQLVINAFLDDRPVSELNLSELSQIETIHQTSSGLPKLLSGNILNSRELLVPQFVPCILPTGLPGFQGGGTENRTDSLLSLTTKLFDRTILCFPNPAGDFVQFDLSHLPAEMRCGNIIVFDLMGKVVAQKSIVIDAENIIVDTRNIPDGIYFYRATCSKYNTPTGRFVVKKT